MAVSAYDASGRLKKHALLGTSLAVDPNRNLQRQAFEDLYTEAKGGAGSGRAGMLGTLSERYGSYERDTDTRLADIARQKGDYESGLVKFRDKDKERQMKEELEKFQAWGRGTDMNRKKLKRQFAAPAVQEAEKNWKKMTDAERYASRLKVGGGMQNYARDYILGGEQRAKDAIADYESKFNAEVDRINEAYIPLQEEEGARQMRLADRVELYNMFLGG